MDKHIPCKVLKPHKDIPWLNHSIKPKMRERKRLYDLAKTSCNPHDWFMYRKARNNVNSVLKSAYHNYCSHLFDDSYSNNCKRFWSFIKRLHKENSGVSSLRTESGVKITSKSKADTLNQQFQSVFTKEDDNIPYVLPSNCPSTDNLTFSVDGIQKLLQELKHGKAPGPDNIPTWFLQTCSAEVAPVLQVIFTQSLKTHMLPKDWLSANITPIYKKGDRSSPVNYRPISLTSVCCKIMEHIIFSFIMGHLERNNLLNPNQHGFRPNHSCQTQLILLAEDILKAMDLHYQVDLILLDFSKAFDTVPHKRLLTKLHYYGIYGPLHDWINAWLTGNTKK